MNKRNNNLLIIILFILSINDIQSNTDFNGIIRNATKISPLIWQHRNEVLIKKQTKNNRLFTNYYKSFDWFSFVKSVSKELNNHLNFKSLFPNLTLSCSFQMLNISEAINNKEEWAFQGI